MNPNQMPGNGDMYPGQVPPQYQPQQPRQPQPVSYSQQKNRRGPGKVIVIVILALLLVISLAFGLWAYGERSTYKNQSDELVAAAVEEAKAQTEAEKEAEFAESSKNPYKTYVGPSEFGSVSIVYPKTWAAFVTEKGQGSKPIDGYMHPNFVPGTDSGTAFALHFEVVAQPYDQVAKEFNNSVEKGLAKAAPVAVPNVPGVSGLRIDGAIDRDKEGTMVLFPLRDKTLKISTESTDFLKDFNGIILPNLKFSP